MYTDTMNKPYDLTGQKVLIIGGAGRMGAATAMRAHEAGARVILVGRSRQSLEKIASNISEAQIIVEDVTDPEGTARMFASSGKVDHVMVTVSAAEARVSDLRGTELAGAQVAYQRVWAHYNVLHLAQQFVTRNGSVTLISGSSGRKPLLGFGVWTAVHGAIEALARAAAIELAPMRVNVVSPGSIGMRPFNQLTEHAGVPDDVARAVVALMTNPAITNAVLDVDGGEQLGEWNG
jgi:NAD(P)-dependent dehydrogenase (short-subunit alcohol dehydrogenase family)